MSVLKELIGKVLIETIKYSLIKLKTDKEISEDFIMLKEYIYLKQTLEEERNQG